MNKTFEVIRSKRVYGAFHFKDKKNGGKPTITITKSKDDGDVLELLFHEVLEIVCELMRIRYVRPDDGEAYEFHYTHREHDVIAKILSQVFQQIL